ncbi:MAG: hypothetical protein KC476_11365 [Cyanobacteria bacterium HKST-UBA06]|nr:hypothetical protein [Cyanobacteria bacterium HKST-UBA05]MCA9799490.1 hypothetical protein [Cyanobacteria bacterium HKST-UBA04]MCA9808543.1 hypothetical protein [Cyanobacteria bacterium HKST-UBA06]MCA9841823.1 hypothetical protein [Cyanobacteria bacterium HKST-UBA03]
MAVPRQTTADLSQQRTPCRNINAPVYFVIRGAQKRRAMAVQKAQSLQKELGVIPKLTCVK